MPSWNRTPGQKTKICDSDKWNQWLILWNTPWSIQRWRNSQNLVRNRNRSQEKNIHWAWLLINVLQCNYAILLPEYLNWFRYLKLEVCGCSADGDYSSEIKRCLLLGRKAMTNLDSILKSLDITLLTNVCLVKAMVFPVVMYGCESWSIKKAECQRIDAFELWCWIRLLWVPWTARRSNQSILKESVLNVHWKDWCWSWNSNTLATWCDELTHLKRPWCWERLKAEEKGTTEDKMAGWHHRLNGYEFE